MSRPFTALAKRYWPKVDRSGGPTACWPWLGALNGVGYGRITSGGDKGRPLGAHRIAWEFDNGKPVPDGLWVLHSCDNRACCNALHLFLGTAQDNTNDMMRKGRHVVGARPRERCKRGHLLNETARIDPHGRRYCLPCRAAIDKARYIRNRNAE